jgi:anhydro-N-acetylmuramic acid kinase
MQESTQRVIGLMSGTSVDGIDAALVELSGQQIDLQVTLLASQTYPYPAELTSQILAVASGEPISLEALAQLDDAIAQVFAQAALDIQRNHPPASLIGSHGQTVFHRPSQPRQMGYTQQLGRGEIIAQRTGLRTVTQFRHRDIALGGQGAPLVSRIDVCLFSHPERARCVQNIGGIGNVTFLPPLSSPETLGKGVLGWDTGPGNVLMDLAITQLSGRKQTFDADGAWAAMGQPRQPLIDGWLAHPYFDQAPPKSTGRELFGPAFLANCLADAQAQDLSDADILATLTDLTAQSIAREYERYLPQLPDEVFLCGGGSRNAYLRSRLQHHLAPIRVGTTADLGIDCDAKEAIAFAILAYWHQRNLPGNLPVVTGAHQEMVLGICHPANA